jgi:hypothetical protein
VFADDDEKVCGILPGHPRDFGAAREALVAQLRREYPRVRSLRWSAVDNDLWAGHLPGQV